MKAIQRFSKQYLEQTRNMSPESILQFLEDFRVLHGKKESKSILISLKVPEVILKAFRGKAEIQGLRYQTQIKVLMEKWINE